MDQQLALIEDALRKARTTDLGGMPLDISVSRQYGDSTVTLRTNLPVTKSGPSPPMRSNLGSAGASGDLPGGGLGGVNRLVSTASFFGDEHQGVPRQHSIEQGISGDEVIRLSAEIDRLKRKALSRGVNLTSKDEDVPSEDVAMLRQVFALADSTGDGFINEVELGQMHQVLGEPLSDAEVHSAFKAMDTNRSNTIDFDDFLSWYTLAHSRAGVLSKKGQAYTSRFKKMMTLLGDAFDAKHLTNTVTGQPRSLEFRVQFHYNDHGQLKQISPWHDIPLYTPCGNVNMVVEIPKWSRAKFEIATGEEFNPIKQDTKNGKLRDYNYGDMLFNYGAFPQTWEDPAHVTPDTGCAGDNDPIDACEIGTKMFRTGSVVKVKVLGCLAMIDDGETDWKVICIATDDVLAPKLNDIDDVERLMPGTISVMREWLRNYKVVDGKPQNAFGMDEKAMDRDYTLKVIQETNEFWKTLTAKGQKTV